MGAITTDVLLPSDSSNGDKGSSWSSETTWTIASGSLENSVTFDSSYDSPGQSESGCSPRKLPPLVLNPPAEPDSSGPCEIKLDLLQKYSIRQIYVRSTARVYEVYYAQSQNSANEYLCTVRCNIAERDEQVLQTVNVEEFPLDHAKNGAVESPEENSSGGESKAPSEDDWVEVKVVASPVLENGTGSLSNKTMSNTGLHIQDYYEATAEISDSDPCTSLTIRLLSLQNKSVVYIDEVYVFAEPVGSIESENQAPQLNSAIGSSLMAMFVPALMKLPRSSDQLGKVGKVESLQKTIDVNENPAYFYEGEKLSADQQYMKLADVNGSRAESIRPGLPNQTVKEDDSGDPVVKTDFPYSHIEKVLEQLVSRVSRIEEVCLRFEENMLKPINSMESRIQQVEQQLELLITKNSHNSGSPTGTRICAPSFSCESNFSSFHIDGSDSQPHEGAGTESERKELTPGALLNTSDGISNSVNGPRFLPSLVVTAPEFSCGDDEQDDDVLESLNGNIQDDEVSKPLKDSSSERKKIDDILAAALSGFLSSSSDHLSRCEQACTVACDTEIVSLKEPLENLQTLPSKAHEVATSVATSEEPLKYTQICSFTAPEFIFEENGGEEDPERPLFPTAEASSFASKESEGNSVVPFSDAESGVSPVISHSSDCLMNNLTHSGAAHVQDQALQEITASSSLSSTADQAKWSAKTDGCATIHEIGQGQPSTLLSPKKMDVPFLGSSLENHFSEDDTACIFLERSMNAFADQANNSVPIDVSLTNEKTGINSSPESKDVLEECLGCNTNGYCNQERIAADTARIVSTLVDFKLPILDVKFSAPEIPSSQTSLEALISDSTGSLFSDLSERDASADSLFSNLPELNVSADYPEKGGGDIEAAKETDSADRDDGETVDPVTSKHLLVDLGIYDTAVSSDEECGLDYPYNICNHEMVTSLI